MRPVWTFSVFSLQSYSCFCERSFFLKVWWGGVGAGGLGGGPPGCGRRAHSPWCPGSAGARGEHGMAPPGPSWHCWLHQQSLRCRLGIAGSALCDHIKFHNAHCGTLSNESLFWWAVEESSTRFRLKKIMQIWCLKWYLKGKVCNLSWNVTWFNLRGPTQSRWRRSSWIKAGWNRGRR